MRLRVLLPVAVLLMVVVAACAPPPELRNEAFLDDTSLIDGDPCEAPCWRDIIPGETSWRDARIIVEDDAQLTELEVVDDDSSDARLMAFNQRDGGQCCQIFSSEDGEIVNSMLILLKPQMTLSEIIDIHGEPSYAVGDDITPDQTLVTLIYPDKPLLIHAFAAGLESGSLTEESEIIGATYLTEADMAMILTSNSYYDWEGYQPTLSSYFDGNFDHTGEPPSEGAADDADTSDEADADGS